MNDNPLEARVWRAVELSANPAGLAQALHNFLPRCTLTVRPDVPTARILREGDRIDVAFGAEFLARELADDRDFLFVLLHEVYHHVLGHLRIRPGDRLSRRCPHAANLAADMLVNSAVMSRFFPDGVPLLSRMYKGGLPACLLKPVIPARVPEPSPAHLRALARRSFLTSLIASGHSRPIAARAWAVHELAWRHQAPYEQVLKSVISLLTSARAMKLVDLILLLGNHDGTPVIDLPWLEGKAAGHGNGGPLEEIQDDVGAPPTDNGLAEILRRALERDPNRRLVRQAPATGVVCSPGRSDLAFLAAGFPVTLFHGARPLTGDGQGAHVYLDVSGSVAEHLPGLHAGLAALRDLIAEPMHQFSTRVVDCSLEDLARGIRRTDGGTRFLPVLEHAIARRYHQIVVVTDGVGPLPELVAEEFRRTGASLHLVLVGNRGRTPRISSLLKLAQTITSLDVLRGRARTCEVSGKP